MKTYLQTPTNDPPLQGKGVLSKHTLVCHHQGMFGCRENERKRREKRENCNLKQKLRAESFNEKLGLQKVISGLYSHTRCVKYQKYQKYMITLGTKWEIKK